MANRQPRSASSYSIGKGDQPGNSQLAVMTPETQFSTKRNVYRALARSLTDAERFALRQSWSALGGTGCSNRALTTPSSTEASRIMAACFKDLTHIDREVRTVFTAAQAVNSFKAQKDEKLCADPDIGTLNGHARFLVQYIDVLIEYVYKLDKNVLPRYCVCDIGRHHGPVFRSGHLPSASWERLGEFMARRLTQAGAIRSVPFAPRAWNILIAWMVDNMRSNSDAMARRTVSNYSVHVFTVDGRLNTQRLSADPSHHDQAPDNNTLAINPDTPLTPQTAGGARRHSFRSSTEQTEAAQGRQPQPQHPALSLAPVQRTRVHSACCRSRQLASSTATSPSLTPPRQQHVRSAGASLVGSPSSFGRSPCASVGQGAAQGNWPVAPLPASAHVSTSYEELPGSDLAPHYWHAGGHGADSHPRSTRVLRPPQMLSVRLSNCSNISM